jgi:hypothetical protein
MPKKRGRPIGTTREAGYKVSPGRPKKKKPWEIKAKTMIEQFKKLFSIKCHLL